MFVSTLALGIFIIFQYMRTQHLPLRTLYSVFNSKTFGNTATVSAPTRCKTARSSDSSLCNGIKVSLRKCVSSIFHVNNCCKLSILRFIWYSITPLNSLKCFITWLKFRKCNVVDSPMRCTRLTVDISH
jgi:hypothetical protein